MVESEGPGVSAQVLGSLSAVSRSATLVYRRIMRVLTAHSADLVYRAHWESLLDPS